jgi:methylmalonyl-CoA carboxyltransferase large subunit
MVEKKTRKKGDDVTAGLLSRIAELEARIDRLEAARDAAVSDLVAARHAAPPAAVAVAPPSPLSPPPREEVTEEVMLVIAAAVAAFLGERAHIRQVRLLASEAWAQQGRVSVMASHRWAVHR